MNAIATPKKIHRFLVTSLPAAEAGTTITISDERIAHQIHRVLKLQPGETIAVFTDGGPNMLAEIVATAAKMLTVRIKSITPVTPLPRTIIAAVSIVKGDAFELIVQKLTEIGVSTIVPLITGRTVKQAVRIDRLQIISDEALEQCGGSNRVHIAEPLSLAECFAQYPHYSIILAPTAAATDAILPDGPIVYYVGPEGGWNEQDEAIIAQHRPFYLQLTGRILRTETAAILAAYALLWK